MIYIIIWIAIGIMIAAIVTWNEGSISVGQIPIEFFSIVCWPLRLVFIFCEFLSKHKHKVLWRKPPPKP